MLHTRMIRKPCPAIVSRCECDTFFCSFFDSDFCESSKDGKRSHRCNHRYKQRYDRYLNNEQCSATLETCSAIGEHYLRAHIRCSSELRSIQAFNDPTVFERHFISFVINRSSFSVRSSLFASNRRTVEHCFSAAAPFQHSSHASCAQMTDSVLPRFVSVEFPGLVNNVENAVDTFGGISCLTKTYNHESARLELRFRPNDCHSHSTFGDRVATNNLLVKCVKKKKVDEQGNVSFVYETYIVGVIDTTYRFQSLVDYQYMPMARKQQCNEGKPSYESIIEKILPVNPFSLPNRTFNTDAPLFILPTIFSRFDSPSDYFYRNDPKYKDKSLVEDIERQKLSSVIGINRRSRSSIACLLNWNDETPTEPAKSVIDNAMKFHPSENLIEEVKKYFEIRPIWSRNALMYTAKCARRDLKYIIPCVAYYFANGPFRCMWIRFGYDPRKDKSSKIYQTLDFRVKNAYAKSNSSEKILAKRSIYQYQLPLKKNDLEKSRNRYRASVIEHDSFIANCSLSTNVESERNKDEKLFAAFSFRPGLMPAYRQLFYQLCDIQVDDVQKLVHCNDGDEPDVCDEKDGWCIPGTIDQIRSIMSTIVDEMLEKDKTNEVSKEKESSDDDLSDDEYLEYIS